MEVHDYWLTIPYGIILLVGGFVNLALNNDVAVFACGITCGLLLLMAALLSISASEKRHNSYFAFFLQIGITTGLTFSAAFWYVETLKIPPILLTIMSGFITIFYIYKLATGGNFPPRSFRQSGGHDEHASNS